ncbi:MAG: hypothetical protein M4D80_13335 [Myxococcota bacterium]|nr:hypothetical protein [Myxococcota bacterium]
MNKFRETLWFKKGLPDPSLPDAGRPDADLPDANLPDAPAADSLRPLEDRYTDDGSVTAADVEELSLNTPASSPSTKR